MVVDGGRTSARSVVQASNATVRPTWLLVATVEANMSSPPALGLPPAVKQNGSLGRAAAAAAARTTISVQLSGGGSPQPCCCTTTIRGDSGHRVG